LTSEPSGLQNPTLFREPRSDARPFCSNPLGGLTRRERFTGLLSPRGHAPKHLLAAGLLDRQLLAVWLNFANGVIDFDEQVDTDGNGTPDTPLNTAVATAEAVRLDPTATKAQLLAQKDILGVDQPSGRVVGRGGLSQNVGSAPLA